MKTNLLFFTKGRPTEHIWYYDLSDVKVNKGNPLTVTRFDEFFRLLPERDESERSWTVDVTARKQQAAEQAKPFHDQAHTKKQAAARWKERLDALRKVRRKDQDPEAIEEANEQFKALTKEARQLDAKAEAIENAVYDLKAVNPNKKSEVDTRTPDELLDLIEAKGREIAAALAVLRRPRSRPAGSALAETHATGSEVI